MLIVAKEKGLKEWSQTKADCMVAEETPNGTNIKIDYKNTQIVLAMEDTEAGLFIAQFLVTCQRARIIASRNVPSILPNLLIHHSSDKSHGWETDCGLECVGGVLLADDISNVTCEKCLKKLHGKKSVK